MGFLKKGQLPVLVVNVAVLIGFSTLFIANQNYELLMYIGVILYGLRVINSSNNEKRYREGKPC